MQILKVIDIHKKFDRKEILQGVSFALEDNQVASLVGSNGCGKTTIANCITGFLEFERGKIALAGKELEKLSKKEKNIWLRKHLQYVIQNPYSTLHPMKKIKMIFQESIDDIRKLTGKTDFLTPEEVMKIVDLPASALEKYPRNFSGGENQRITIARALLVKPSLLIADEPISSSDVTTQAMILNLFKRLKDRGVSILFITHDIAAAHYLSDRILIMNDGKIIEEGDKMEIFAHPQKKFTKEVLNNYFSEVKNEKDKHIII